MMLKHFFIYPLEHIARIAYLSIYGLTSNYGLSLFILSLVSNLLMNALMRPMSLFSERETAIQNVLNPQMHKIRSESRGAERHRRISGLYRRYSYHPVLGLRSAVPVLVQLPFLFAAYIMLSNLPDIKGVSFLIINDISKPDSMFLGINILPFLMTIINISTALVTKNFNLRDKLQAGALALFFLVILYNAPAALIIFWTMNNVLSLIRTIIKHYLSFLSLDVRMSTMRLKLGLSLKKYILYPVLIGMYPVLFLYSNNIEQAVFSDALIPLAISLLVSVSILVSAATIFHSYHKGGFYSSIVIFFLFFHGFFSFAFQKVNASPIIALAVWMLLFTVLLVVLAITGVRSDFFSGIALPANIFSITIIFILMFQIISYRGSEHDRNGVEKSIGTHNTPSKSDNATAVLGHPDIYYIILDGYGSSAVLKEYFKYDNSDFIRKLVAWGFYVAEKSKSNYQTTFLSLASSLNMDYIQNLNVRLEAGTSDRNEIYELTKNNKVMQLLHDKGYKFIHFQTGWGATKSNEYADIDYSSGTLNEFAIMWMRTTVLAPFTKKLGITGNARKRILKNFEILSDIKKIKGPKFIFAHLVIPHPPYLFGANGEDVSDSKMEFDGEVWKQKDRYVNQVIFVNKKMLELVNALLGDKSYRPVVIIQGDHGPASSYDEKTRKEVVTKITIMKERMHILNAYYFPREQYQQLYKTISPVNSFRIVLNKFFGAGFNPLKDIHYWSPYFDPFNFRDVTDQLKE